MNKKDFLKRFIPEKDKWYRYAYWSLRDPAEAQDVVQETFIRLWNLKDRLHRYEVPEALALKILKNLCIDHLRKVQNSPLTEGRVLMDQPDEMTGQEYLEHKEFYGFLTRTIAELPENQRMILQLRQVEGYEIDRIAQKLGMTKNTVEVNLSRARKKIRKTYNDWKEHGS